MEEVQAEKLQLDGQLVSEREAKEKASEQHKESEASLSETIDKLKEQMETEKDQLG